MAPHSTTDIEQVIEWLVADPTKNLAVITNSIVVIEVDYCRAGDIVIDACEQRLGVLPSTMTFEIAGQRQWLFYALGDGPPIASVEMMGFRLHGTGALVLVPPSKFPGGRAGRWMKNPEIEAMQLLPGAWNLALRSNPAVRMEFYCDS